MKTLKFFVLLISSTLIGTASAAEDVFETNNVTVSGFATGLVFSNGYSENALKASMLVTHRMTDNLSLNAQLHTDDHTPIDRITIDYAFEMPSLIGRKEHIDGAIQVGRFPRINALYNDITDHPGTYGMAMLPSDTYPPREVAARLTMADGIRGIFTTQMASGLLKVSGSVGTAVIHDRSNTQSIMLSRSLREADYNVTPENWESYDYSISYERNNWRLFYGRTMLPYDTELSGAKHLDLYITTYGGMYSYRNFNIEVIQSTFDAKFLDPNNITTAQFSSSKSIGTSIIGKWFYDENISFYIKAGKHKNKDFNAHGHSTAIGVTYDIDHWSVSVERQWGIGNTPINDAPNDGYPKFNRNTSVLAITRRF